MSTEEVLAKVRARFGSLPGAGESTAVRAIEPPPSGPKRITMRHPAPHAQIILAFRAPSLRDPDFPALVLFDALLAGGRGFAGGVLRSAGHGGPYPKALGTVLDEATAGLASDVRSDWQVSTYPYVYTLSANVPKADGLASAEAALFRALDTAAAKAWTAADVSRAVHQMRTGLALDLDDQRGRVHQLALFEVAGGYGHLETLPERVARVTLEDVRRFVRERLGPDRATVGWFEPLKTAAETTRPPDAAVLPKPDAQRPARPPARSVSTTAALPVPPSPTKAAGSIRTSLRLASGLTVEVEEQSGSSLASLHGRIEVGSAHDGGTPGLAALAAAALSEPLADETADAPTLTWTPRHDPVAAVNLHAIEVTASVLPEDLAQGIRKPGPPAQLPGRVRPRVRRPAGRGLEARRRAERVRGGPAPGTGAERALPCVLGDVSPPVG